METIPAEEAIALGVALAVASTVPRLKSYTHTSSAEIERRLWPAGAPEIVTWTLVRERLCDAVEESAASLVARDIDLAQHRGHPWPGGASIRRETAVRVGITESLLERARAVRVNSALDTLLFGKAGPSEPVSLDDLLTASATALLILSRRILERDPALDLAQTGRLLVGLYGELLATIRGLLAVVGEEEAEALVAQMLALLAQLRPAPAT